jgi:F-type H+-transporting ATPase subunit b
MEITKTLGIDWRLLIWSVVNFLIVFFILKKYAFGPIVEALARRTAKLEQGLKDAAAAKENLVAVARDRESALKEARTEAGKILSEARTEAERLKDEVVAKTKTEAEEILNRGKERLTAEKEAMIASAKEEMADLLVVVLKKLLPRVGTKEGEAELVKQVSEVIKEKI